MLSPPRGSSQCLGVVALSLLAYTSFANPNHFAAITPGAPTQCMGGTPYYFGYRKGTVNKLVIEFEGGGACWNELTCKLGTAKSTVDPKSYAGMSTGIHDGKNKNNPVAEWHHVYVSYCTADVHTGNTTVHYFGKSKSPVKHFGFVNAKHAVDFAFKTVPAPTDVLTAGCSAGCLGSIVWAPYIMQHYKSARNFHFGDSYVGVLAKDQWNAGIQNWGLQHALAPFIPAYAPSKILAAYERDEGAYLIAGATQYFKHATFSVQTSNADAVQGSFFALGGGELRNWTNIMRWQKSELESKGSRFYSPNLGFFIHAGSEHCVSTDNTFYKTSSDGTSLVNFVRGVLAGKPTVVDCEPNCKSSSDAQATLPTNRLQYWKK